MCDHRRRQVVPTPIAPARLFWQRSSDGRATSAQRVRCAGSSPAVATDVLSVARAAVWPRPRVRLFQATSNARGAVGLSRRRTSPASRVFAQAPSNTCNARGGLQAQNRRERYQPDRFLLGETSIPRARCITTPALLFPARNLQRGATPRAVPSRLLPSNADGPSRQRTPPATYTRGRAPLFSVLPRQRAAGQAVRSNPLPLVAGRNSFASTGVSPVSIPTRANRYGRRVAAAGETPFHHTEISAAA